MSERLQKVLARAGVASRREIERWIEDGRIVVNGETAKLGQSVGELDKIKVDGEEVRREKLEKQKLRVIIYNKPEGQVSTRKDESGRPTIFESLPKLRRGRWINIGRLDINTQGLMLFTNNGELANYLMHPSQEFEREYAVRILGDVKDEHVKKLISGVDIEGEILKFRKIAYSGGNGVNSWYHVVVTEGKNREVRKLWESQGFQVSRLIRVRYAVQRLPKGLARGRWEELTPLQVKDFCDQISWQHSNDDASDNAATTTKKPFQRTRQGRAAHSGEKKIDKSRSKRRATPKPVKKRRRD